MKFFISHFGFFLAIIPRLAFASIVSSTQQALVNNCTYANTTYVANFFNYLNGNNTDQFLATFLDNVDWTIEGSAPLSGHYKNLTVFYSSSLGRLEKTFDQNKTIYVNVTNIIGGCNDPWTVVEFNLFATCKNGRF